MNDKERKLPKYIIILPDKDIIEAAQQSGFRCKVLFHYMINWLVRNIDEETQDRKEKLKKKRLGAVLCESDPKIIWVKMVVRPFIKNAEKSYIFAQCNTFNAILEAELSNFRSMHLIKPNAPAANEDLFDLRGNLSTRGLMALWNDVNTQLSLFDKGGEHRLKPWIQKAKKKQSTQQQRTVPDQFIIRPSQDPQLLSLEKSYHQFNIN